jgi:hypothetical protein
MPPPYGPIDEFGRDSMEQWVVHGLGHALGVSGALYGGLIGTISVDTFFLDMTFMLVAMLVVGGVRSAAGAVVGVTASNAVSADIRTGLCSRAGVPPGKSSARPETGAAFLASPADSGRQRPRYPASPAAKPRNVKDYSDGAGKPELRRTAWWSSTAHTRRPRIR